MDPILVSPHQVAQLEEHLLLMQRIVSESVAPARRRGWLLEQCRHRDDDERVLWRALALPANRRRRLADRELAAGRRRSGIRTHWWGSGC